MKVFLGINSMFPHFNKGGKNIIWTIDLLMSNILDLQNDLSHHKDFSYFSGVVPIPSPINNF